MSDKDRRKKDGKDTNKKNQAMRESVQERQSQAHNQDPNDQSHEWKGLSHSA